MLGTLLVFTWLLKANQAGLGDLYYGLPVLVDPIAWVLAGIVGLTLRRRLGDQLPFVTLLWIGLFVLHLIEPLWS